MAMNTCFRIAAAALTLSAATLSTAPAQAATLITFGNYDAGQAVFADDSINLGPGTYRFRLELSGPADFVDGEVTKQINYNFYCDPDGNGVVYCGGDDVPIIPLLEQVTPTRYEALLRVDAPYVIFDDIGPGRTEYFDDCCKYRFEIQPNAAGSYSFSYLTVPEARVWALMILGFGAVGAVMRRRAMVRFAEARARA